MNRIVDNFLSSAAWTGREDLVQKATRHPKAFVGEASKRFAVAQANDMDVMERRPTPLVEPKTYEPLRYDAIPAKIPTYDRDALAEYIAVANEVGVAPPDLHVEEFKAYLIDSEMTVFDLSTVISFMDAKSKAEGRGWGWNWVPLRGKDRIPASFGTAATRRQPVGWGDPVTWRGEDRPASDHYSAYLDRGGLGNAVETPAYSKVVPLHALKKVAQIEKSFPHQVAFMVSDYAPAPAFKADPFLMAVIPNAGLNSGEGRFVIDVWDEPGFGIEQMLKSGL